MRDYFHWWHIIRYRVIHNVIHSAALVHSKHDAADLRLHYLLLILAQLVAARCSAHMMTGHV